MQQKSECKMGQKLTCHLKLFATLSARRNVDVYTNFIRPQLDFFPLYFYGNKTRKLYRALKNESRSLSVNFNTLFKSYNNSICRQKVVSLYVSNDTYLYDVIWSRRCACVCVLTAVMPSPIDQGQLWKKKKVPEVHHLHHNNTLSPCRSEHFFVCCCRRLNDSSSFDTFSTGRCKKKKTEESINH